MGSQLPVGTGESQKTRPAPYTEPPRTLAGATLTQLKTEHAQKRRPAKTKTTNAIGNESINQGKYRILLSCTYGNS
jgi:hypothetical protein